MPPILPMLAKSVAAVPDSADYSFEPKWDGPRRC
jgi:ATP-dependent DNA ligase